jgi:hypothetical protein
VWQHQYEWRKSQVLGQSVDTRQRLSVFDPGYTISCGLNFSVGDLNGDGREDLILRRSEGGRTNTYRVYLQQTNGMFAPEPVLTYSEKIEPRSWLCWADLNRDGAVDMIKSVWLNEPSFLPGLSSGKVVVSIYVAGADGRIPSKPQQIFRKSDWTPAVPILDVDGDGYPDLVLGYSQLDSREGVRKQITAQQLDFCLRFHFNRENARLAGGGAPDSFSREADCQVNVAIHLDQASLLLSGGRREYFERYVKVAGDFNGDGKTDLMVRDHGDTISAYFFLSREKGFSRQADLRFNCPEPIDGWEVRDMNNDGVSDMIVRLGNQHGYRIFVSRK